MDFIWVIVSAAYVGIFSLIIIYEGNWGIFTAWGLFLFLAYLSEMVGYIAVEAIFFPGNFFPIFMVCYYFLSRHGCIKLLWLFWHWLWQSDISEIDGVAASFNLDVNQHISLCHQGLQDDWPLLICLLVEFHLKVRR